MKHDPRECLSCRQNEECEDRESVSAAALRERLEDLCWKAQARKETT